MAVALSPIGGAGAQFFDNNGNPLSGGKLYTYEAGTTTPATTYTSLAGTTAHTNPIILDSAGRVPGGEIWLTLPDFYKFVLKTSTEVLLGTWDNIQGYSSGSVAYAATEVQIATAGQTLFVLTDMFYNPGTNTLAVYVDGVNQVVNNSYVESTPTSVTFMAGLHVGAVVKFVNVNVASADASAVSYEPGFVGSVATTVAAKLQQTVSVKDFGAAGDGVMDDTAAIQAALDSVYAAGGGTLYFPAGEYLVTTIAKVFASNITVVFQGAGKMASVLRKTGASTTPILDLSCTTSPGVTYSPIRDIRIRGNAKAHDGIRLTNWARFNLENVYVNGCDIGINNRGSLVFIAKGCTIVSNNTGYKADVFNGVGANLIKFIGGSISANTSFGVDLGDGEGFSFDGTDFGGNGTIGDVNTGAVLIRSNVSAAIGVSYGSFTDCWFELNRGTTIRVEASALNLGIKDTQCLSAEGGNVMNIGDIRSLQLINFIAPSAPDTVTVACKQFISIGGIIGVLVDNSTQSSSVLGTTTATAGVGTRSRQFNPQIGGATSYGVAPGVVFKTGTASVNTGTGETDLATYTLPANAINGGGKGVRITAYGSTVNNANAKDIKVYFAGTVIGTLTFTTSQINAWRADGEVLLDSGTTHRAITQFIQGGTTKQTECFSGNVTNTTSDAAIIKVTGTGGATSDVVLRGMIVEFIS
jgi:hypothetical protein